MAKPVKTSKPKPKRLRAHGLLPAGFQWRDGRPAWIPSPTRRKQGWRRCDLKTAQGGWMSRGDAIAAAEKIATSVDAWAKGEPVSAAYLAFAPKNAGVQGATAADLSPRSIGTLLDAYYDSLAFKGGSSVKGLAPKTQADYRSKHKRFLETVVDPERKLSPQPLAAKVEKLRALPIDMFEAPSFGDDSPHVLEEAYDALRQHAGETMAYGVLGAVSAWLGWCVKKRRVLRANPAELVERAIPAGRIRFAAWAEVLELVRCAEAAGMPSIADAVILAIDLSWSQQDILALTWSQLSADGHVRHRRIKTGNAGNPRLLALGRARLDTIRARNADAKVTRLDHIITCELTGKPWVADTFRHKYAEIRTAAAKAVPSVATFNFQDTRDTAITYYVEAGLTIEQICSRSLHSPKRASDVVAKHYGAIHQGVSDTAAEKLEAYFEAKGYVMPAAKGEA